MIDAINIVLFIANWAAWFMVGWYGAELTWERSVQRLLRRRKR